MEDYVDNAVVEIGVLRRKLQSKAEALVILTQELEHCRNERDQLKLIAEQAQNRSFFKKTSDDQIFRGRQPIYNDKFANLSSGVSSFDHVLEVREQNKAFRYEIQDLKQKLREAYGDIKVLRASAAGGSRLSTVKEVTPAHQREELVEQLEKMGLRVSELEADLRSVLDEKQELVSQRETYRCKVHRLNHQINTLLQGDSARLVDIDALVMDNKYLQEQLHQLQAEKDLAHQALIKYKSMLERKRNKGSVKLGNQNSTMVISHKQVQELLEFGGTAQIPNTEASLADLKSLCQALLEGLQDKSLALSHQKKANKILASRVCDLEQRLGGNSASQLLLQGYSSAIPSENPLPEDLTEKTELSTAESQSVLVQGPEVPVDANDSLPEDIQELVTKALQDIYEEESKPNRCQDNI